MHRDSFKMIISLINNRPAFKSKGKKPQTPVEHQLMVFLYYIGVSLTEQKKSVKRILHVIDCCIILHNLLIDRGDDEIPADWLDDEDEEEGDDDDDEGNMGNLIGEYDFGNPIVENDERRRRCMDYFKDMGML